MWLRRLLRSERGSQMVEFALIAPILIYLVLSIPVFGMFVRTWIVIAGAARAGAREACLLSVKDGQRELIARNAAAKNIYIPKSGSGKVYFDPEQDVKVQVSGDEITVSVSYHQPSYLPLLGALLGGDGPTMPDSVRLTASATFLIERGKVVGS